MKAAIICGALALALAACSNHGSDEGYSSGAYQATPPAAAAQTGTTNNSANANQESHTGTATPSSNPSSTTPSH